MVPQGAEVVERRANVCGRHRGRCSRTGSDGHVRRSGIRAVLQQFKRFLVTGFVARRIDASNQIVGVRHLEEHLVARINLQRVGVGDIVYCALGARAVATVSPNRAFVVVLPIHGVTNCHSARQLGCTEKGARHAATHACVSSVVVCVKSAASVVTLRVRQRTVYRNVVVAVSPTSTTPSGAQVRVNVSVNWKTT